MTAALIALGGAGALWWWRRRSRRETPVGERPDQVGLHGALVARRH